MWWIHHFFRFLQRKPHAPSTRPYPSCRPLCRRKSFSRHPCRLCRHEDCGIKTWINQRILLDDHTYFFLSGIAEQVVRILRTNCADVPYKLCDYSAQLVQHNCTSDAITIYEDKRGITIQPHINTLW